MVLNFVDETWLPIASLCINSTGVKSIFRHQGFHKGSSSRYVSVPLMMDASTSLEIALGSVHFSFKTNDIFNGAQVVRDVSISSLMDIADLSVKTNPAGRVDVIVQLDSFLPMNPALRLYNPSQRDWLNFDSSGTDSVSSSPTGSIGCPAAGSSNYQPGLTAGNQCIKVTATDIDAIGCNGWGTASSNK